MERSAPGDQAQTETGRDVGVFQMGAGPGRHEYAMGSVRPTSPHRAGEQHRKWRSELFRDPPGSARPRGNDLTDFPRVLDELREVSQSSDGEMDQRRLLRLR